MRGTDQAINDELDCNEMMAAVVVGRNDGTEVKLSADLINRMMEEDAPWMAKFLEDVVYERYTYEDGRRAQALILAMVKEVLRD